LGLSAITANLPAARIGWQVRGGFQPSPRNLPTPKWDLGATQPVEGWAAEQDEVDQQAKDEQEAEQGNQGSTGIENLPDLVHVYISGLLLVGGADATIARSLTNTNTLGYYSQGRHNHTRMCATTTIPVNTTKLDTKMPWNSFASSSVSPDIERFSLAIE
jgi:hypothetical protein